MPPPHLKSTVTCPRHSTRLENKNQRSGACALGRHSAFVYCSNSTFGLLTFLLLFYRYIALVLQQIIFYIHPRYAFYIGKYINNGFAWQDIILSELLFKFIIFFFSFIALYLYDKKDTRFHNLCFLAFLGVYFTIFNANFYESTRIAYYFNYFLILFVPLALKTCFSKDLPTIVIKNICCLLPVFLYWLYLIMIIGAYGTNNYSFNLG
jgi:hypothetical protein